MSKERLTGLQEAFCVEYVKCLRPKEAAEKAGYKGNAATLAVVGYENLRKPNIKARIDEIMDEFAMTASEARFELSEIARLDMGYFIRLEEGIRNPYLDLHKAKEAGLLRFIKKIKYNAQGQLEIELYDKQSALVQIGKWDGLSERTENLNFDLSDLSTEQLERIAKGEDVYSVIATPGAG